MMVICNDHLGDINWFSEDHGLFEYGNPDQEAVEGKHKGDRDWGLLNVGKLHVFLFEHQPSNHPVLKEHDLRGPTLDTHCHIA